MTARKKSLIDPPLVDHCSQASLRCLVTGFSGIGRIACVGAMFQLIGKSCCGGIGLWYLRASFSSEVVRRHRANMVEF
jgi:hypothetical protein